MMPVPHGELIENLGSLEVLFFYRECLTMKGKD